MTCQRVTQVLLRATAREETLIKVAAERQGVNVTDFIISAARCPGEVRAQLSNAFAAARTARSISAAPARGTSPMIVRFAGFSTWMSRPSAAPSHFPSTSMSEFEMRVFMATPERIGFASASCGEAR